MVSEICLTYLQSTNREHKLKLLNCPLIPAMKWFPKVPQRQSRATFGALWITPAGDAHPDDHILDIHPPDKGSRERETREDGSGKPTFVGYYGPRHYDHTSPGLIMIFLALMHVFSAHGPLAQNSTIHASVFVYIASGALSLRVGSGS